MKDLIVYVEKKVLEDPAILDDENFGTITKKFCTFRDGMKTHSVNFAMTACTLCVQKVFIQTKQSGALPR